MDPTIALFTKMLKNTGGYSLPEAAAAMGEHGFDAADLTVRPGGYVEPGEVREGLPEAVDQLADGGVEVPMITTGVTGAGDYAEAVFETAAALGVGHVKLGYWLYDGFGTLAEGLDAMREDLAAVAALSREHPSVRPAIHVHAGDYLSADAALLYDVLSAHEPGVLGAYADAGHMAVEGGRSGWKLGLDRLGDYVEMVSIKDFGWVREDGEWRVEGPIPVGEGIVRWEELFDCLAALAFSGPMSIHAEYYDAPIDDLLATAAADREHVEALIADR
jgi:sugar phosphate isomerase/epimerase